MKYGIWSEREHIPAPVIRNLVGLRQVEGQLSGSRYVLHERAVKIDYRIVDPAIKRCERVKRRRNTFRQYNQVRALRLWGAATREQKDTNRYDAKAGGTNDPLTTTELPVRAGDQNQRSLRVTKSRVSANPRPVAPGLPEHDVRSADGTQSTGTAKPTGTLVYPRYLCQRRPLFRPSEYGNCPSRVAA